MKECWPANLQGILARALSINTGSMSTPNSATLGLLGRKVEELEDLEDLEDLEELEELEEEEGAEGGIAAVAEVEICRREPGKVEEG